MSNSHWAVLGNLSPDISHVSTYTYIHIHTHTHRERERERESMQYRDNRVIPCWKQWEWVCSWPLWGETTHTHSSYLQCICKHAYIHTHIHTHIHPYIHTYTHTRIHTYIHIPGLLGLSGLFKCMYMCVCVCVRERAYIHSGVQIVISVQGLNVEHI